MSPVICPACGRPTARASALSTYRYNESGISNLWLRGGVTRTICSFCKQRHIKIERESQLLQVVALKLLMDPRPLSGSEMRFLRGACRLSQAGLAEFLRHRRETISEREAKENPGIDFAEELLFRYVILRCFTDELKSLGNNFLPKKQRRLLVEFSDLFLGFFSENFAQEPGSRSSKLVAELDSGTELWRLDEAA